MAKTDRRLEFKNKDELGDIAAALNSAVSYLENFVNKTGEVAEANLDVEVELQSEQDSLAISFNQIVDNLRGLYG